MRKPFDPIKKNPLNYKINAVLSDRASTLSVFSVFGIALPDIEQIERI